jgi:hypothetical protein
MVSLPTGIAARDTGPVRGLRASGTRSQAESGKDADLRTFAEGALPTLREHLELAKQVQSQITAARGNGPEQKHAARFGGADPTG